MASFSERNDTVRTWSSLFLPVEDEVIFASFTTLFSPLPLQSQSQQQQQSRREGREVNTSQQFSPKEGGESPLLDGESSDTTRSPLFALCGERADAVVCVLENRQVVFFDLTSEVTGPREVRRLKAMKNLRGCKYSKASCASLIPLDICYMCRVPAMSIPSAASRAMGDKTVAVPMTREVAQSSNETIYLRGVVGSTDGRVDVFSEHSYVFGFVAHDSAVVAVSAICSGSDENNNNNNNSNNNEDGNGFGGDHRSNASEKQRRRFEDMTANMGFVTCGTDGVVYVWKRQGLHLKPQTFDKSAFFSRTITWCVVQPCSRDWMLSGMGNARESLVVHTTPGLEHELRVRSSVTFEDVEDRVLLPGSCFTRTTALAANNEVALVARGRDVFAVLFAETQCDRIFTARHTVTGMYMANGEMAAATCDNGGLLYVLALRPVGLLGCYNVQCGGPVRSISMHAASRLITIVAGDGTVEIAKMPDEWDSAEDEIIGTARIAAAATATPGEPQQQQVPFAGVMDSVAAARVLHALAQMQKPGSKYRSTLNEGEQAAVEESLLLARMGVPEEANMYLHRTAGVVSN